MTHPLLQDFPISRIEPVIEAYKELLGWKIGPPDPDYPLQEHFASYEAWRNTICRPRIIPSQVIELADYALGVELFRKDWDRPDLRRWLAAKLRDSQKCLGFLWEFRCAVALSLEHKSVKWLGNTRGKSPDIRITCDSGAVVYLECIRRLGEKTKYHLESSFGAAILGALTRKSKQRAGFTHPLEVTLFVPKTYMFGHDQFHDTLGVEIRGKFRSACSTVDYAAVSGLRVITDSTVGATFEPGRVIYDRTLPSVMFVNPHARNPLPQEYWTGEDEIELQQGHGLEAGPSR